MNYVNLKKPEMKIHIQFKAAFQWGIAILLFCGLASCSKVDISDPFVKGGEFTFPAKPDSVLARGGKYRLELSWLLISDPKITKYKVYWNNRRDSVEGDVVRTHTVDTIRVMFNDWEEGIYNFDIYTYDKHGNRSIKVSTPGKVYGESYQNSLHTRSLRSVNKVGKQHYQINWMEAETQFYSANVEYKGSDGQMMNVIAKNADSRTELLNFPNWGGEFSYTAKFLPEPKALDTFYLAVAEEYKAVDFSWHNYSLMFGHFGDLMVQDQNQDLFKLKNNGDGTFSDTKLAYQGFKARAAISHKNDIIILDDGNFIKRAPAPKDGVVSAQSQLSTGWSFGTIMSLPNGFLVRRGITNPDYGKFNYYPFNGTGFPGPNKLIFGGGYEVYDMMIYITSGAIIAKKPTGELYRMSCDALGVTGPPVLLTSDWADVDYIAPLDNSIVARKKNDELWIYPMNGVNLGVGKPIVADIF
jgi:hypothetical protein